MKHNVFDPFPRATELFMVKDHRLNECFYPIFGPMDLDGAEQFLFQFLGEPKHFYAYTNNKNIGPQSFILDSPWASEFIGDIMSFRRGAEPEIVQTVLEDFA